jgi:hypothetical protein
MAQIHRIKERTFVCKASKNSTNSAHLMHFTNEMLKGQNWTFEGT